MSGEGESWTTPEFHMGRDRTFVVPMEMHVESRRRLVETFRAKGIQAGVILLQSGQEVTLYDTDHEVLFRQDSWFQYLFGVREGSVYGAICLSTGRSTLFIPRLPEEYRVWMGEIHSADDFRKRYAVDEALYTDDLSKWIVTTLAYEMASVGVTLPQKGDDLKAEDLPDSSSVRLHLMSGKNTDSGNEAQPASFSGRSQFQRLISTDSLFVLLAEQRVHKSEREIALMRYVSQVSSNAHTEVMRVAPTLIYEYELEAKFQFEVYSKGGCRRLAYSAICACGPNNAVLHYGHAAAPNDRKLKSTDMGLLDMGAEYHCYASDITCSYPLSGKFTADQKAVYEGVLNAQRAVLAHMKPGNKWTDCHRLAEIAILEALLALGIVKGASAEKLAELGLGAVFFPHGLGHLIGLDTHDVGGYLDYTPPRDTRDGLKKLRTARVLETDMVLTNEPGCYFIDYLLDMALADPVKSNYLDAEVVKRFRGTGGVRLEDVVVVTADGPVSLSACPRTVDEIEDVMAGGQWPPKIDNAPELKREWYRVSGGGYTMERLEIPTA